MRNEVRILSVEDRDGWEAEHEDGGLPSQSWRYAHALNASGIEPRLAVVRAKGARMLMLFFEREWRGRTDIATVPGLSGTSISPISSAPLSLWREYAAAQGWVASDDRLARSVTTTAGDGWRSARILGMTRRLCSVPRLGLGGDKPEAAPLASTRHLMRQYLPKEIERLLGTAGLEIQEQHGDLERSAFDAESKKRVVVCGLR